MIKTHCVFHTAAAPVPSSMISAVISSGQNRSNGTHFLRRLVQFSPALTDAYHPGEKAFRSLTIGVKRRAFPSISSW